jgi:hypothetical protein
MFLGITLKLIHFWNSGQLDCREDGAEKSTPG